MALSKVILFAAFVALAAAVDVSRVNPSAADYKPDSAQINAPQLNAGDSHSRDKKFAFYSPYSYAAYPTYYHYPAPAISTYYAKPIPQAYSGYYPTVPYHYIL